MTSPTSAPDAAAEFHLDVTCTADRSGGLTIQNTARLDKGCGGDAEVLDDTGRWTVLVPPPSATNPFPTVNVRDKQSCFGPVASDSPDICSYNAAFINLTYYSLVRP